MNKIKTITPMVIGIILVHLAGIIPYSDIYQFVKTIEARYIFLTIGVALISIPLLANFPKRERSDTPRTISFWWLLIGAIAVLMATWASTYWLLSEAQEGQRLDAIRTGLTVGAGTGGAMALLISARRQWLGEKTFLHEIEVAKYHANDALEKRITELQANAADQISSESAATRLSGLYTLERLAQDNPRHRQVIINIICAYLRMPFNPTEGTPEERDSLVGIKTGSYEQEREVRLAAQSILALHLHEVPNATSEENQYWPGMRLNLSRATLIDLDLAACKILEGRFEKTAFHGKADFSKATLGSASFTGSRFFDEANFSGCQFTGNAIFQGVEFSDHCDFNETKFLHDSDFQKCKAREDLSFEETLFTGNSNFSQAQFENGGHFYKCSFYGGADFVRCEFNKSSIFIECTFKKNAEFMLSEFADSGIFDRSTFHGITSFKGATFKGDAQFEKIEFRDYTSMKAMKVRYTASFEGSSFRRASFGSANFGNTATLEGAKLAGDIDLAGAHFSWGPIVNKTLVIKSEGQRWPEGFFVEWKSDTEGFLTSPVKDN